MVTYFFDTSALIKRYISEIGSNWVSSICDVPTSGPIFISELTEIEIVSAIYRRAKGGDLTETEALAAAKNFDHDCSGQYVSIELTKSLLTSARNLTEVYALRSLDAIQFAAALECVTVHLKIGISPIIFVSADKELNLAAQSEGLLVEDPNNYP